MRIKLNGSRHKHDFYEALDTLTLTTWFIHGEHVPGTTSLSINHRSISQPSPNIREKLLADKNVVLGPILKQSRLLGRSNSMHIDDRGLIKDKTRGNICFCPVLLLKRAAKEYENKISIDHVHFSNINVPKECFCRAIIEDPSSVPQRTFQRTRS